MSLFRPLTLLRGCLAAGLLLIGVQDAHSQTQYCLSSSTHQYTGTVDNVRYELWNPEGASGPTDECMTVNPGSTFSGTWTNAGDYLARRGWHWGSNTNTNWKTRGGLKFRYSADWQPVFVTDGNSSIGVYGWVHRANNTGTTAEFYIVENWYQWNHGQDGTAQSLGRIAVNGFVYEVIKTQRTGQPTPWGNMDFPQYVSVRVDRGTNNQTPSPAGSIGGNINVAQHFAAWEKLGLDMSGELVEVAFLAEGYLSTGTVNVSVLDMTTLTPPTSIAFSQTTYDITVDQQVIIDWVYSPSDYGSTDVTIVPGTGGSTCNNISLFSDRGKWFMTGAAVGSCTLTIYSQDGTKSGTATVNVTQGNSALRVVEYRAVGNRGGEQMYLLRDGKRVTPARRLTTSYQTFRENVYGEGEIALEFVNDDAVSNGKAARVDYLSVDGQRRETEAQALNTGSFANGRCGGGSYSEWLYCAGKVNYGPLNLNHTVRIRARGNAGGEHIHLLINGQSVNTGWWLTTSFQEFTVNVVGDGDINVRYDNDGGTKDVVIDWLKVDSQNPRQAENMQYNTGFFANGRCGGGSRSEWLHCNGVIGFGRVSDNFN
jgi:hypothetical protein